jgi:hypothetical protein
MPPRRNCDHTIPLIQGAQPVNIRSYRHKPELKNEIEPILIAGDTCKEERWNLALVCRLSSSKLNDMH